VLRMVDDHDWQGGLAKRHGNHHQCNWSGWGNSEQHHKR